MGVLENLKVIEIASVLAGPSVGMFFAERGSKVVKIENKLTNGDITRSWKLPVENKNVSVSAYFSSVNWGKEHLFLDFLNKSDHEKLLTEIKSADIVITNFKYGDAEKFNLTFDDLCAINPTVILGEITGFGSKNKRLAYDLVLQAETGFMSINGTENTGPVKMPVAFIDLFAGHQLKEGLLEALLDRSVNNTPIHVEVSLFDAGIAALANQASNYLMTGKLPERIGSKHPNIAPYGEMFNTKDSKLITFAIGSDKQFKKLLSILEIEDEDRFSSNVKRVENRKALKQLLANKVKLWNSIELNQKLVNENVPAAIIKNLKDVFENTLTENLILNENVEGLETKRVKSVAYHLSYK